MKVRKYKAFKISDYLTSGKAAEFLGVTQATLRNWYKSGKIMGYVNPKSGFILYKKEDIEKALEEIRNSKRLF